MSTLIQSYTPTENQRLGRRLPHIVGGTKFKTHSKKESHAQFPSAETPRSPTSSRRSFSAPLMPRLSKKPKRDSLNSVHSSKSDRGDDENRDGGPLSVKRSRSAPQLADASESSASTQPTQTQTQVQSIEIQQNGQSSLPAMPSKSLSFPHVASIFVKLRRVQRKSKAHHIDSNSGLEPITHDPLKQLLPISPSVSSTSSPSSSKGKSKSEIETPVENGVAEETGTRWEESLPLRQLVRLEILDVFSCIDAVDVEKLLRASRLSLLQHASPLQANVLTDERWSVSICGPKHRSDGSFRVHVRYAATACFAQSARDPRRPVALKNASGVPGLMTVASRETAHLNVVELFPTS